MSKIIISRNNSELEVKNCKTNKRISYIYISSMFEINLSDEFSATASKTLKNQGGSDPLQQH